MQCGQLDLRTRPIQARSEDSHSDEFREPPARRYLEQLDESKLVGDLPVLSDPPVLLQDLFPSWLTLALSLLVLPNSLPSHSVDSWFPYLSLPTLSLVSHTRNNAESNTESLEVGSEWRKEEIVKKSSCNRMIDGSRTSTIGGDLSGLWCIQRVLGGIGEKGKELTVWGSRVEDRLRKQWSCSVHS